MAHATFSDVRQILSSCQALYTRHKHTKDCEWTCSRIRLNRELTWLFCWLHQVTGQSIPQRTFWRLSVQAHSQRMSTPETHGGCLQADSTTCNLKGKKFTYKMKIHHKCIKCGTTVYAMGVSKRKYLALQTEKKKGTTMQQVWPCLHGKPYLQFCSKCLVESTTQQSLSTSGFPLCSMVTHRARFQLNRCITYLHLTWTGLQSSPSDS